MELSLALLLVCYTLPTTTDGDKGDENDEDCRYGYYTHSGNYEEYYISCGSKDYCCGSLMDRACCPTTDYSDDNDESPTVGLLFGSIAACTMFIILCACICGKVGKTKPSIPDPERPQIVPANHSTGAPSTTTRNQTSNPNPVPTIHIPPPSNQTSEPGSSPPPSYEECLEKNLIVAPPAYDTIGAYRNEAYLDSETTVTSCTGQSDQTNTPANSE